jgi:hypothetical protein
MRLPEGIYLRRPGYRVLSALVLAVIVGGIVLLARLFGEATEHSSTQGQEPAPVASPVSTQPDDSVYTASAAPGNAVPRAALEAGESFVQAWLQPGDGRTQATWYDGVVRYSTVDLAKQMRDVDPKTNPATTVTGPATGTVITADSVRVAVPTNAGTATVLCVRLSGGWRAATIDLGK